MEYIKQNIDYPLAAGTLNERSVPLNAKVTLAQEYDRIFKFLWNLHHQLGQHPQGRAQQHVIEGIWLVWCFASHDIAKLQAAFDDLKKEHEAMQAQIDELIAGSKGSGS